MKLRTPQETARARATAVETAPPVTPSLALLPPGADVLAQSRARPAAARGGDELAYYERSAVAAELRGEHDFAALHRRTAELLRAGWPT